MDVRNIKIDMTLEDIIEKNVDFKAAEEELLFDRCSVDPDLMTFEDIIEINIDFKALREDERRLCRSSSRPG